jgi:hypothetical protein
MDLGDVYRIFHPSSAQYIFFSAAMEPSPKLIIYYSTKKVSANVRK